jgi:DNA invertase Pin-like site-specific DNA recombinase
MSSLNIMTAVSQWEREAIVVRTRDALSHKRARASGLAIWLSVTASRVTGGTWNRISEQDALTEIRRLRGDGMPLRGIAAALNHRAYRTRRGTAWRLESVARVLKQNQLARATR